MALPGKGGRKGKLGEIIGTGVAAGLTSLGKLFPKSPASSPEHSPRDDDAQPQSTATSRGSGSYLTMMSLPVLLDSVFRMRQCKMCSAKVNAESPYNDASPDDKHGGYWPWQQYR